MKLEFKEEQKFTQWWLWILLIALGLLPIIGIYKQLIRDEPFGSKPMTDIGLIIFTILIFGFIAFIYLMTLKTEINEEQIWLGFFPFFRKVIKWEDVSKAEVIKYGFVGGWGIRLSLKYGVVYNVRGNMGLHLQLKTGEELVIGTQKPEELSGFLDKLEIG